MATSVSLTTKIIPPTLQMGLSTSSAALQQRAGEVIGLLQSITGESQQSTMDSLEAVEDLAAVQGKIATGKADRQVSELRTRQNILSMFGVDQAAVQKATEETAIAQQQAKNLETKLTVLGEQVQQLSSVPITNPLQWIASQFKLESAAQAYNATAQQYNTTQKIFETKVGRLQQLQSAASNQATITPAVEEAQLREEQAAQLELIEVQARLAREPILEKNRGARLSALATEMQMSGVIVQNQLALSRLAMDAMQMTYMQEDREERRAERAEARALRQKKEVDLMHVNRWRSLFGGDMLTVEEWDALGAKDRGDMLRSAKSGQLSLGATPAASLEVLEENNAFASFARQFPGSQKFLEAYGTLARNKAKTLEAKGMKPDAAIKQAFDDVYREWRKEPGFVDRKYNELSEHNPYRMRPDVAATAEALKHNSIAQYVKTLGQQGERLRDADLAAYGTGQVAAGKPPAQVAAELAQFYRTGISHQYATFALPILGLDVRSVKEVGEYPIGAAALFSANESYFRSPLRQNVETGAVQAFNPVDWERYLTASAAKAKAQIPLRALGTAGILGGGLNPIGILGEMADRTQLLPEPQAPRAPK